jgi:glutathione synthase/RimK-type ligase-like ATP-grasp enzyme
LLSFKASAAGTMRDSSKEIGFELLGYDFMIDTDLNVKLIEVNQNPCLSTLSQSQGNLIKKLLNDVFWYESS